MSNKVCSPVVVENPIIPTIASSSALYHCRLHENNALCKSTCSFREKNFCRINAHPSAKNYAQSVNNNAYHSFNGRELVLQFENLQCTPDDKETTVKSKKSTPKYSSALTLKAVKNRPLKKAVISKGIRGRKYKINQSDPTKFVLQPSKLNRCVKTAFNRSYADSNSKPSSASQELKAEKELSLYHDFSIACSKELETIEQASVSSTESSLRPRSSSLPAAGASASHETSNTSTSAEGNGSPEPKQTSSNRRSRRKHLSKCDTRVSNNDLNEDSSSIDQRITCRGSKRRISPPEHSITSIQQSAEHLEDERDRSRDNLDASIDRLADYLEDSILLPKKMSFMAEMMYT